jgi:hypothetical protein
MSIPSEHAEQVTFISEFEKTWPGVRIFAIPNGGMRNVIVAQKLKAEGLKPGVPDTYIPAWRTWVEMKRTKGGTTSKEQKDWHQYLREDVGDTVIVAKGWAHAMEQLRDAGH